MTDVSTAQQTAVARPPKVLVPLIKQDLNAAAEAEWNAAMPFYRAAGEKMLEVKPQMKHADFKQWLRRNFDRTYQQASKYMSLVASETSSPPAQKYRSLDDYLRRGQGYERVPGSRRDASWQEPIRGILGKVDVEALRQSEMKRAEERELERKLALQLIDIGYKALATKLHPDKGGSRDAMARLNHVRDRLKQSA